MGRRAWTVMIGCTLLGACGGSETGSFSHIDEGAGGIREAGATGGQGIGGRSTGGVSTGGSAPMPDAGGGPDAGLTDAAPDAPEPQDVYVSPTGSDSAAGTRDAPVQTIAHAATIVTAPHRIVLLAGTFDETTQPEFRGRAVRPFLDGVQVPAGIAVVSDELWAAHLVGSGAALSFSAGGKVQGIAFQGFLTAISGLGGSLAISGSSFADCGSEPLSDEHYCIEISLGEATLSQVGLRNYVSPSTNHLLSVGASAEVIVNGGRVAGIAEAANGAIFRVSGQLTLDDVLVENNAQRAIVANGGSAILRNTRIERTRDPSGAAIELANNAQLAFLKSRVIDNAGAGVISTATSSIFEDCDISRNGGEGIAAPQENVDLTVQRCSIDSNGKSGIVAGGQLIVGSTTFLWNGEYGISGRSLTDLRVRSSRFANNALGGLWVGRVIDLTTGAGSLGTVAYPGLNAILGTASAPGIVVNANAAVYAVGNTWVPDAQGADATGLYTVGGAGAMLVDEWGAADVAGANYRLEGAGASVRLAENP